MRMFSIHVNSEVKASDFDIAHLPKRTTMTAAIQEKVMGSVVGMYTNQPCSMYVEQRPKATSNATGTIVMAFSFLSSMKKVVEFFVISSNKQI